MPVKIRTEKGSVIERIDALRKQIKPGEGLTIEEVADAVGRSRPQVHALCRRSGWTIKQYSVESRAYQRLLVNPKTLALCRKK
jgi:ParB-like chromosome segregation protein Spo0J